MGFFSEHRTAISGAATAVMGTLTALATDPNLPALATAINPRYGAYATAAMGVATTLIGLYNSYRRAQQMQAIVPSTTWQGGSIDPGTK